jgi:hypothetical protein
MQRRTGPKISSCKGNVWRVDQSIFHQYLRSTSPSTWEINELRFFGVWSPKSQQKKKKLNNTL